MAHTSRYLFTSDRLGFRNWSDEDIPPMVEVNADPEVMKYFPSGRTKQQTSDFIKLMQSHLKRHNNCYFAVDELATGTFIGFVGLCYQDYAADFTPCVDIGWRLARKYWGQGYATEGARACLDYGFQELSINKIYAVATAGNEPSINVMHKIGMAYQYSFQHPDLVQSPELQPCVLYRINSPYRG